MWTNLGFDCSGIRIIWLPLMRQALFSNPSNDLEFFNWKNESLLSEVSMTNSLHNPSSCISTRESWENPRMLLPPKYAVSFPEKVMIEQINHIPSEWLNLC